MSIQQIKSGVIADDAVTAAKIGSLPAGSVLQVVEGTTTTQVSIASTSYTDTGLSASITPTSASSKILVIVSQHLKHYQLTNNTRLFDRQLLRDATQIGLNTGYSYGGIASNGYFETELYGSFLVLDTPATTSSITYKTQAKANSTADDTVITAQRGSSRSTIILMEIAA